MVEASGTNSATIPAVLHQVCGLKSDPSDVAARSVKAGDEANFYRVDTACEDNRICGGCRFRRERCRGAATSCSGDHRHLTANQIGGKRRQSINLTKRPSVFNHHVLTFNEADFFQASPKLSHGICGCIR